MKPASSDRRPIHHSPIFWIGIALCLAAIAIGPTTSRGDRYRSHDENWASDRLAQFSYCEGFRMPAHDDGATRSGAGVRKPAREETASALVVCC
jgi:hypothetical protein